MPTQVIPAIAGVLVLPILARELAPSELGILAIAQTLITLGRTAAGSWLCWSSSASAAGSRLSREV
jgi:O-antigen/teichoic acid export membrane protein